MRTVLPLVVFSLTLSATALAEKRAPKKKSRADVSQIVGLALDDPASLLPFGKKQAASSDAPAVLKTTATDAQGAAGASTMPAEAAVVGSTNHASIKPLITKLAMPALFFVAVLAGLIVIARKKAPGRHVQVMEVTALGKGRSVVVADIAGTPVLLGVSEGGVTMLMDELPITPPSTVVDARTPTLLERMLNRTPAPAPAPSSFDAQLYDKTDEDDEIRRKLAAHLGTGSASNSVRAA